MKRSERLLELAYEVDRAATQPIETPLRPGLINDIVTALTFDIPDLTLNLALRMADVLGTTAGNIEVWFASGACPNDAYRSAFLRELYSRCHSASRTTLDSRRDVWAKVDHEGLDYFIRCYTSADSMPDAELARAFVAANQALDDFIALADDESDEADEEEEDEEDE